MDYHKLKIKNNNFNRRRTQQVYEPKEPDYRMRSLWEEYDQEKCETKNSVEDFLKKLRMLPSCKVKSNRHLYRDSAAILWSAEENWRTAAIKELSTREFSVLKSLKEEVRGIIVSSSVGIL